MLPQNPPHNGELVVRQITGVQQGLFAYILTMVPNLTDADDILQETNAVLWRKQDEFQQGTDFWAWSSRIAYLQTMAALKKCGRDRLAFGDDLVEQLAAESTADMEQYNLRSAALAKCLAGQSNKNREMIRLRDHDGFSAAEIGKVVGRSKSAVYDALYRVRMSLRDCINNALSRQDSSP